jgi:hypothetical protein
MTPAEGTLAILGIEIIRILIIGLAEETIATPDLHPAEITAGMLDVQTVATDVPTAKTDVPTAGTDATTAAIIAAPVSMTEILEIILEIVAKKTVTEITEAAETRGRGPEKRDRSGPLVGALVPTPKQKATIKSLGPTQRPMNQGANTTCSRSCILEWTEAATVPPTMIP